MLKYEINYAYLFQGTHYLKMLDSKGYDGPIEIVTGTGSIMVEKKKAPSPTFNVYTSETSLADLSQHLLDDEWLFELESLIEIDIPEIEITISDVRNAIILFLKRLEGQYGEESTYKHVGTIINVWTSTRADIAKQLGVAVDDLEAVRPYVCDRQNDLLYRDYVSQSMHAIEPLLSAHVESKMRQEWSPGTINSVLDESGAKIGKRLSLFVAKASNESRWWMRHLSEMKEHLANQFLPTKPRAKRKTEKVEISTEDACREINILWEENGSPNWGTGSIQRWSSTKSKYSGAKLYKYINAQPDSDKFWLQLFDSLSLAMMVKFKPQTKRRRDLLQTWEAGSKGLHRDMLKRLRIECQKPAYEAIRETWIANDRKPWGVASLKKWTDEDGNNPCAKIYHAVHIDGEDPEAWWIQAFDYLGLDMMAKFKPQNNRGTKDKWNNVYKRWESKTSSNMDEIVKNNLPFVKHIVYAVCHTKSRSNRVYIDFEALMQEGVAALIQAIQKFDPTRGTKFTGYAGAAIRNAAITFINKEIRCQNRGHNSSMEEAKIKSEDDGAAIGDLIKDPSVNESTFVDPIDMTEMNKYLDKIVAALHGHIVSYEEWFKMIPYKRNRNVFPEMIEVLKRRGFFLTQEREGSREIANSMGVCHQTVLNWEERGHSTIKKIMQARLKDQDQNDLFDQVGLNEFSQELNKVA